MAIGTPTTLGTNTISGAPSITLTTTATVPSGALVILLLGLEGGTAPAVSSTAGGGLSYSTDKSLAYTNIVDWNVSIISAQAPAGLASSTGITVTFNQSLIGLVAGCYCTGLETSSVKDIDDGQGQASVTSWDTSATSTTVADTLVIGASLHDGLETNTATGGATELHDFQIVAQQFSLCTEYKILSSTASTSLTGTWTGSAAINTSAFVAYKGIAGAATTYTLAPHNVSPLRA